MNIYIHIYIYLNIAAYSIMYFIQPKKQIWNLKMTLFEKLRFQRLK